MSVIPCPSPTSSARSGTCAHHAWQALGSLSNRRIPVAGLTVPVPRPRRRELSSNPVTVASPLVNRCQARRGTCRVRAADNHCVGVEILHAQVGDLAGRPLAIALFAEERPCGTV